MEILNKQTPNKTVFEKGDIVSWLKRFNPTSLWILSLCIGIRQEWNA